MTIKFKNIILGILAIFAFIAPIAIFAPMANAQAPSKNVKVELISEKTSTPAGSVFHIALTQKIAPEWHTYWRNPGDVGDATRIEWSLPNGIEIGEFKWANPSKLPYGEFINYGYSGDVILPLEVKIANNLTGKQIIKGKASWLECKDVCIPGEAEISINIDIGANIDGPQKPSIDIALSKLPKKLDVISQYNAAEKQITLGVFDNSKTKINNAYFFPFEVKDGALIDHAKPQILELGAKGFSLKIDKSMSFPEIIPNNIVGLVEIDGQFFEINAALNPQILQGVSGTKPRPKFELMALLSAIGFAFLGGIILNLMPCVFPVLAMKIFGLTKIAHGENKIARQYGLFYFLGVMVTFTILGGLLFMLKALGGALGWGFQLQDPSFLILMVFIIFALGFNLLGTFEIGTSLQGIGANLAQKSGNIGAFFSGVLAVLVASPCTAPFMGAALGFAISQNAIIGLLVFLGLGFGFALPFVALTFYPKLLAKLPKPGPWMDNLKKALSIPMFLTAIWLLWVLSSIVNWQILLSIIIVFALLITSFIIIKKYSNSPIWLNLVKIIFVISICLSLIQVRFSGNAINETLEEKNYIEWSQEKVDEELASGKIVFVNFTADWCITCKVNEKAVFKNPKVIEAFKANNVSYLVADWTKKDEKIARALSSHGRVGVPLYLIYDESGKAPKVLPQLLTPNIVIDALEE